MKPVMRMFSDGEVTFIDRPVSGHSWIVIQQNNRSYVFYDPEVVSVRKARLHYYTGTKAGLCQAVQEWIGASKEEYHA